MPWTAWPIWYLPVVHLSWCWSCCFLCICGLTPSCWCRFPSEYWNDEKKDNTPWREKGWTQLKVHWRGRRKGSRKLCRNGLRMVPEEEKEGCSGQHRWENWRWRCIGRKHLLINNVLTSVHSVDICEQSNVIWSEDSKSVWALVFAWLYLLATR